MDPRYQDLGTENELATILSHYSSNFVYDVVNSQIERVKAGVSMMTTAPNVVAAWEQNFKAIMDQYGAERASQIQDVRNETYQEIIEIICQAFDLNFSISDVDIYSAAYTLYDFFVCNLSKHITNFYANYTYKERDALYSSMGLADLKKSKDSSTIYGKKMYKDIKIAVIAANITHIIEDINASSEFDFATFVGTVLSGDFNLQSYLMSIVADRGNFFANTVVPIINANLAEYITNIRFGIQDLASAFDMIQYVKNEEIVGIDNN